MENFNQIDNKINIPTVNFDYDLNKNNESETQRIQSSNRSISSSDKLAYASNDMDKIKEKREKQMEIEKYIAGIEKKTKSCLELLEKTQIT